VLSNPQDTRSPALCPVRVAGVDALAHTAGADHVIALIARPAFAPRSAIRAGVTVAPGADH
jgi:hypothetical protein